MAVQCPQPPGLSTDPDPWPLALHSVGDCLHRDLLEGRYSQTVSQVLGFKPSSPTSWKAAPSLPAAF